MARAGPWTVSDGGRLQWPAGKYGICGDPWTGPFTNEAGGANARGGIAGVESRAGCGPGPPSDRPVCQRLACSKPFAGVDISALPAVGCSPPVAHHHSRSYRRRPATSTEPQLTPSPTAACMLRTATFAPGQVVDLAVTITANHLGRFGFRICALADPNTNERAQLTEGCLDQHVLQRQVRQVYPPCGVGGPVSAVGGAADLLADVIMGALATLPFEVHALNNSVHVAPAVPLQG